MKLDEAILHCRATARGLRNREETLSAMSLDGTDCAECAAEHEQLAEWLTELKQLRDAKCGTWIEKEHYRVHGEDYKDYVCSECDHRISRPSGFCPDYCEDCGAKNAINRCR